MAIDTGWGASSLASTRRRGRRRRGVNGMHPTVCTTTTTTTHHQGSPMQGVPDLQPAWHGVVDALPHQGFFQSQGIEGLPQRRSLRLSLRKLGVSRGREAKIISEEGMSNTPVSFKEQRGLEGKVAVKMKAALESEGQASRSSGEAQGSKEQLELDMLVGHDDLGTKQEQDVLCCISQFASHKEFQAHHQGHVRERSLRVHLRQISQYQLRKAKVKVESRKKSSPHKPKLKNSKVGRGRGRKRREVKILSEEGMSDTPNSFQEQEGLKAEPCEEEGREEEDKGKEEEYHQEGQEYQQEQDKGEEGYLEAPEAGEQSDGSNSGFNPELGEQELNYEGAGDSRDNSRAYQAQFESYPTASWFTDYKSGPRIAAATAAENASEGGTWARGANSSVTNTTTSQAGVSGMMSRHGSQWSQAASYSGAAAYPDLPSTSIGSTNMPRPLCAPLPPTLRIQYPPSPPPRVQGRPPLTGHVGQPSLHQAAHLQPTLGPGHPPASSILQSLLMPALVERRGIHQTMYPSGCPDAPSQQSGKRQMLRAAGHSPSKTASHRDIKNDKCQIIAVANRSDRLPVISNAQSGSATSGSQRTSVHVFAIKEGGRNSPKAVAVTNSLASQGITVMPAAGERQDGSGERDGRQLLTAQALNLSLAGQEQDRDDFVVLQAPTMRGNVSNSSVERPPHPPTVDLTQDVPASGAQGTRHKCHQCDCGFPTASLLADHSRVHQQQQQARMPFKCHLCTAGFSTQKGQQHHYQQFHQLHLSAGDMAIPLVDLRSPVNVQRMAALGIRSFLPLTNLQNRGAGGVVGVPILTLENLRNGHMTLQQWGVSDVLSLGPAKTLNMPR
ncbi:uncharacterized protein LOC126981808 [Eriocheir sinensis]|uniref:uncharacterized protein LOC126981808 n=1 Tax=Eriocheir sinensis TaxID=95602 RepID=UPI0021C6E59C|nr:uncharacterized protein LOC126981808 [Eriocheir sinensis]